MPVSYHFAGRLFRLACVGEYTVSELKKAHDDALEDPRFPEDARFLIDVSQAASLVTRRADEIRDVV
jgi:hypothetical protein